MCPYKLIIFDCDGVLVDSEPLAAAVISEMAAELGLNIPQAEAEQRFNGRKVGEWIKELEAAAGRPLADSFIPEFRHRSALKFAAELKAVPGVKTLLEHLPIPFCLASSGPLSKINQTLTKTELLPYFAGRIFSGYEVGAWKPDPALFLHAAAACNTPAQDCAVVEDSRVGVEAGLAAGMTVFHYQPRDQVQLPAHERLVKFTSMQTLPSLLNLCEL